MAIRTVITRGYGNETFNGTIPLVTLRGYISGAAVTPNEPQIEPVEGGGGWPGHGIYKKKRQKTIRQDDEDLMRIIQEALPAIIKFLRR